MKKVLLISPDIINKKMAGPGIRYWNFAKELSKELDVTLYFPNKKTDIALNNINFKVILGNLNLLKNNAKTVNSIVIQGVALRLYPFLKKIKKPLVIDIYDPFTLENLELRKKLPLKDRILYHETDLKLILEQLSIGDYFICASERQKDYWLGMLAAINRVNPVTYLDNKNMERLIGVVPFGLENEEPVKTKNVLKGVWPGINETDKVIIWGGGIWNWFDPLTLIEAMNLICKERNDIKLFFMGIGHPNIKIDTTVAEQCIELCKKYGLYNKYVFFNDWVEYEERQNYLLEADIGVSTYFNNLETRFSFRTRILDYLWCDLPMVLTKGDYMAELVDKHKLGLCCSEKNPEELSFTILKLIESDSLYKECKNNIYKIKEKYKWKNTINELNKFCSSSYVSIDKKSKVKFFYSSNNMFSKIKYYYVRVINKLRRTLKKY